MGFFDKIKASLTRTKEQFVKRFDEIVGRADTPAQRSRPIDVEIAIKGRGQMKAYLLADHTAALASLAKLESDADLA